MNVLILDTGIAGGQMVLTHEVANYPGYEGISGYMLSMNMKNQAEKFGCAIKTNVKINGNQTFDVFLSGNTNNSSRPM
jgi:thioredoxin reductase (NADPH)